MSRVESILSKTTETRNRVARALFHCMNWRNNEFRVNATENNLRLAVSDLNKNNY
jgi:hypothetical protein